MDRDGPGGGVADIGVDNRDIGTTTTTTTTTTAAAATTTTAAAATTRIIVIIIIVIIIVITIIIVIYIFETGKRSVVVLGNVHSVSVRERK